MSSKDFDVKQSGILPLADLLGASAVSVQQFYMYLPNKDKYGTLIAGHQMWVERALKVLSKIGGGATAIEQALGAWWNPETEQLISEETTIVYTYVIPAKIIEHLGELHGFLHTFGHDTNQGEVMFYWDGAAYRIVKFSLPI